MKKILLYGFLIWLIPFIVAFLIFPIKESNLPLFESIMPVAVTLATVLFSVLYFKNVSANYLKVGVLLGLTWFAISLVIDLPLFMYEGPMKMTFGDYMMDIGLTYLIIPIITTGYGYFGRLKIT